MGIQALLVGTNAYTDYRLRECVNALLAMRALLQQRFSVDNRQTRQLRDAAPLSTAIVDGLYRLSSAWLVACVGYASYDDKFRQMPQLETSTDNREQIASSMSI